MREEVKSKTDKSQISSKRGHESAKYSHSSNADPTNSFQQILIAEMAKHRNPLRET
jgi:hypothetical protein